MCLLNKEPNVPQTYADDMSAYYLHTAQFYLHVKEFQLSSLHAQVVVLLSSQGIQPRISDSIYHTPTVLSVPDPEQPVISYVWYIYYHYSINVCLFSFVKTGLRLYC